MAPGVSLAAVLGCWLVLLPLLQHRVSGLDDFRQSRDQEVEVAGREIARRFAATPERSRPLIMGYSAPVAFYAGANLAGGAQSVALELPGAMTTGCGLLPPFRLVEAML